MKTQMPNQVDRRLIADIIVEDAPYVPYHYGRQTTKKNKAVITRCKGCGGRIVTDSCVACEAMSS